MKTRILLLGLLVSTVPALADDANDVRCREIAFSQSVENQNLEAFASFIESDARFVGSTIQRGSDEIIMAWRSFFVADAPQIKWRPQHIEVLNDGLLALSRGPYKVTAIAPGGTVVDFWGTFNSIWRKQSDGSWKVIFDAGNEASEPPEEDVQAILEQAVDCS